MASARFTKALEGTAVLSGSFLSGSMMTISLISIPVALETAAEPSHLLHLWTCMFHYGHRLHPTIAALTSTLYGCCALRRRGANKSWAAFAWAGLLTMSISPFTWLFLLPTNKVITNLVHGSQGAGAIEMEDARRLVIKWSWMHLVRSIFPLVGGIIAMNRLP
ncbi:hypothetical protein ASPVEDRAFT_153772 [Aspergillus versicolor CBS 583.65]|uniref:DUF1772 domain-containing protein n=1 Tax=Aspergillus versicolor CBS 583.65 TaxID=1036611 RepID=A0A1L9PVN5_ASPVE|nr:uncharacterized protein ASPVEDRAFT_153772 [Aspergillus versicolor CBS 583.65]OJJ05581.1 hypothetical protein ASPVEDRAFT_153772 [Aspergillus versicolor CBS 583.65]